MEVFETKIDQVLSVKRNEANGQDDLFGDLAGGEQIEVTPIPDVPEWDKRTKLAFEREMLGLYVSDHPLYGLEHVLAANRDTTIGALVGEDGPRADSTVTVAGMITAIQRKQNKKGDIWAIVTVEDLEASVEVMMYTRVYSGLVTSLTTDRVVKVTGRIRERDESRELVASQVTFPEMVEDGETKPIVITLPAVQCTKPVVSELRAVLANHPGLTEVRLRLVSDNNSSTLWKLDDRLRVRAGGELFADLKALLGAASVKV